MALLCNWVLYEILEDKETPTPIALWALFTDRQMEKKKIIIINRYFIKLYIFLRLLYIPIACYTCFNIILKIYQSIVLKKKKIAHPVCFIPCENYIGTFSQWKKFGT